MSAARLFYWGSEDRQMAKGLRRSRDRPTLLGQDVDHIEFSGLDHAGCNEPEALGHRVVPAVADWVARRLGPSW